MGVDSVMTVRIRSGLQRRFGVPLPATLLWDRPDADAVAALLAERLTMPGDQGSGDDLPGGSPGATEDVPVGAGI